MDVYQFWKETLQQNAEHMKKYFHKDAYINWHNSNEHFTVDEFIRANCEYPNKWDGEIERYEKFDDLIITATHVFAVNEPLSFHVVSFIKINNDKIVSIDEYWGEDGCVPQWRLDKHIGQKIKY